MAMCYLNENAYEMKWKMKWKKKICIIWDINSWDYVCSCGYYRETSKHYLLHCPRFTVHRVLLFTSAADCLHYHWTILLMISRNLISYYMVVMKLTSNFTLFLAVQNFIVSSSRFPTTWMLSSVVISNV